MNTIDKIRVSILVLAILSSCVVVVIIGFKLGCNQGSTTITETTISTTSKTSKSTVTTTETTVTTTSITITKPSINCQLAYKYLRSNVRNFKEDLWLIFENDEDEGKNETYWIYSDNFLAQLAIWDYNSSLSNQINSTINRYFQQYPDIYPSYLYEVLIGEDIPDVIRDSNQTIVEEGLDYVIKVDRRTGNVMPDWEEYGDLLLYKSLDYHWARNYVMAEYCYNKAYNMFDGKGIYDIIAKNDRHYDNYKLALLIYVSKILHKDLCTISSVTTQLWLMQNSTTGGIIAWASLDGLPDGSANCETTALALISCGVGK